MKINTQPYHIYNFYKFKNTKTDNSPVSYPNDTFVPGFRGLSAKALKAIQYVNQENKQHPVTSIYQLDPEKLDGILDGIELFKNIQTKDLYLLPGTIDILTQRGCTHGCLHCFIKGRNKLQSMKWEDFTHFTEGMKDLKNRLGFHIFEIKREKYDKNRRDYTLSQGFYPYLDADPMEIKSLDKYGNKYFIRDFVKKYYDDMNAPLKVKTVGWDIPNKESQKAAEDLVRLLTTEKYKAACPQVIVSLHPFHKIMTLANKALQSGNAEVFNSKRNEYIERMSNVLKTLLPLAHSKKLLINPQYAIGGLEGSGYTKKDLKSLCADVLTHLEKECKKSGIDSSILTKEKDIEKNQFFEPINPIISIVRSKKQFFNDYSANTYSFEKTNDGKKNIIVSPFDLKHAFGNEVSENITKNLMQQKDFIDNIVINIDPVNDIDLKIANKNKLSKDRTKMFMNKIFHTLKRFKDIDEDKLILRLNYQENSLFNIKTLNKILNVIENKTGKKFKNIEYTQTSPEIVQSSPKDAKTAFKELIDNLNPEAQIRFISQLRKGINIDGQIYIPVINTRSFGEDTFENRAIILKGLKFKYEYPQKYIFDKNLKNFSINYDKNQISALLTKK